MTHGPGAASGTEPTSNMDLANSVRRSGASSKIQRSVMGMSTLTAVLLALILIVALGLRLYGINWDQGGLFHPDERAFLSQVYDLEVPEGSEWRLIFNPEQSTLNPGSFNWGSLPHYALKSVQYLLAPAKWMDLFELRYAGRALSAISDTFTVLLIFLSGRFAFSNRVGLLAALFGAVAVLHVQLAHFFAVDSFMTTFVVATVYFMLKVAITGRTSDSVWVGLMFGLAMATKFSVLPLALGIGVAYLVFALSRSGDRLDIESGASGEARSRQSIAFTNLVIAVGVTIIVLVVTQPYMFLDFGTYVDNISTQGQMVRREVDFPFTRQYEDTTPYIYNIVQLGTWGLGPALGITVWLGLLGAIAAGLLAQRKVDVVILVWVIPYLAITGYFDVKFMRYMLPILPFLLIYGARTLWWMFEVIKALWPNRRALQYAPIALVLLLTVHYTLSFMSVYAGPHPLKDTSFWLRDNAVPGSVVVQEHWEEGIPHVPGLRIYERAELYNDESPQKFIQLSERLAGADYFVLLSNRLYATIPRLPERYPVTTQFYEELFSGGLGYELAHASGRYVGGLGVDYYEDPFARVDFAAPRSFDQPSGGLFTAGFGWADESFSVYEHPQTFIFENVGGLSPEQFREVIGADESGSSTRTQPEIGLLLSDEGRDVQQSGGTWTDITFLRFMPDWLTPIFWYLGTQIFALAVLPLAYFVFRSFPDRGYPLSKPLGMVFVSTLTWLLVSSGLVKFHALTVLLAVMLLAALSMLVVRRSGDEILNHIRANIRRIYWYETLFLLAFIGFLFLRAANPDLWHPWKGGEKPMDFAYLNAVVKSSIVPPYDPWHAGGYLNYYYFGQFMVASLIRFIGIVPSVAYNLAVPMLAAMTVVGAYSIVSNLVELSLRAKLVPAWTRKAPIYFGLLGAIFVTVAGNIDGLTQLIQGWVRVISNDLPFGEFDFWRSSRMMAPDSKGFEITEFPFFTFLFADLHAHLIAIPVAITALAASISMFLRIGRNRPIKESIGSLVTIGILVGSLRTINAWDFPTQLLLAGGLVTAGYLLTHQSPILIRLIKGGTASLFVLVVGHVVYLPFHMNFELFNNGVLRSEFQTDLWRYITIHALFLAVIAGWSVLVWTERIPQALQAITVSPRRGSGITGWIWHIVILILATVVAALSFSGFATIGFVVAIASVVAAAGVISFRSGVVGSRYSLAPTAMVVMALAIAAGVDVFTVKDDIGRMNTVFKFYLQAWTLLALASAYFAWVLYDSGKISFRRASVPRSVWLTVVAVLAIAVMMYPIFGTRSRNLTRFEYSGLGLDGTDYMETVVYQDHEGPLVLKYDLDAIEWLQENVEGSPVVIEGLSDQYRWGNRVSIYTGLPAVIGWDWHQRQQRVGYAYTVSQRRAEVDTFFNTTVPIVAINTLDKYNVRYVYVGEMEHNKYAAAGLEKFSKMEPLGLKQVYPPLGSEVDTPVVIYEYMSPAKTASN